MHGFLAMSFVGALNVGSIRLHFDEGLKTNNRKPVSPYFTDKNYAALSEIDGSFWKYPQRHKKIDGDDVEQYEVDNFLAEFDIKDIIQGSDTRFIYGAPYENQL